MKQVIPGLYYFTGLMVGRVYLIEDADGLTVIDAGLERAAAKVIQQIQAAGRKATDVRRIIVTHAHPDHVGGLPKLKEATGAQVIASAVERPVVEGKVPIPLAPPEKATGLARWLRPPATTLKGTPVDRVVEGGQTLTEVMGGLQVVATPGHTAGHIALWQPEKRILFCGDVIMRLPRLRLPFSMFTVDMEENKRSIRRLAELDASIVCFGHGDPWTQNTAQVIRGFARKVGAI